MIFVLYLINPYIYVEYEYAYYPNFINEKKTGSEKIMLGKG